MVRILYCICFLSCLLAATAKAELASFNSVDGDWSYHWGDLPRSDSGNWLFKRVQWNRFYPDEGAPGRHGQNILWLKLDLQPQSWRDPYLFISSVDLTLQVFESGRQVYHFGEITPDGRSSFAGWPWHMIPLEVEDRPHTLYFRIYSNYSSIGLFGEVIAGERADLLERVYLRGVVGVLFIVCLLVSGGMVVALGFTRGERRVALTIGLLAFDLALMMFAENELSQLVIFSPLTWRMIAAYSYFLIPFFLALVLGAWFGSAIRRISWVVGGISVGFVCVLSLLTLLPGVSFVDGYSYFDGLFIGLCLILLMGCFNASKRAIFENTLVFVAVLALFVSLLIDMLSAHSVIDWIARAGQWGLVLFMVAMLAVYLAKYRKQQRQLLMLTNDLESQVEERTRELRDSQQKFADLANKDFLTGLLNRRSFSVLARQAIETSVTLQQTISLVLFDIDHFKRINDSYGHAMGDLVLEKVAEAVQSVAFNRDLVCRYGGEEFVILMPGVEEHAARAQCHRLQAALRKVGQELFDGDAHVTMSVGLACIRGPYIDEGAVPVNEIYEQLITQADEAMYSVKQGGRDGIALRAL